jgi:hypothetical protein
MGPFTNRRKRPPDVRRDRTNAQVTALLPFDVASDAIWRPKNHLWLRALMTRRLGFLDADVSTRYDEA